MCALYSFASILPSLSLQVCHPSQLGFKPGDKLSVKYMGSDEKGRHMVSRKALLPPPDVPDAAGMTNRTVVEEVTSTVTEQ